MHALDSDTKLLVDSNKNSAFRDIVQFVEMKKYGDDITALTEAVFAEIPIQVENYYKLIKMEPGCNK